MTPLEPTGSAILMRYPARDKLAAVSSHPGRSLTANEMAAQVRAGTPSAAESVAGALAAIDETRPGTALPL
jgi:hypothetical protein